MLLVLCEIVNFSVSTIVNFSVSSAGTHGIENTRIVQWVLPAFFVGFKPFFFLLCSLNLLQCPISSECSLWLRKTKENSTIANVFSEMIIGSE